MDKASAASELDVLVAWKGTKNFEWFEVKERVIKIDAKQIKSNFIRHIPADN